MQPFLLHRDNKKANNKGNETGTSGEVLKILSLN